MFYVTEILANAQQCNYGKIVPKKSHLKFTHSLPLSLLASSFSSVDLEMGVSARLQEASAKRRLKM